MNELIVSKMQRGIARIVVWVMWALAGGLLRTSVVIVDEDDNVVWSYGVQGICQRDEP